MSEELERGAPDLARNDEMTTQELEELLRSDLDAPEGQGSDEETLLHIMEVLAQRTRTDPPGSAARRSWASFQQYYLPEIEEQSVAPEEPKPDKRLHIRPRRRLVAAAVIALLVCIPVTVCALNWDKTRDVLAAWKDGVFSFVVTDDTKATQPQPDASLIYPSLQDALEDSGSRTDIVPTWIPEGYTLTDISIVESPQKRVYTAIYTKDDSVLNVTVRSFLTSNPANIEINDNLLELYQSAETDYYIFKNDQMLQAIWFDDSYECVISCDLTLKELKMMIDSIEKG